MDSGSAGYTAQSNLPLKRPPRMIPLGGPVKRQCAEPPLASNAAFCSYQPDGLTIG
jgi:hypothetical protein